MSSRSTKSCFRTLYTARAVVLFVIVLHATGCGGESVDDRAAAERDVTERPATGSVDPLVEAFMGRAEWAESQGAYVAALTMCDRIHRRDPDYVPAYFLRGRVLGKLNRYEEARQAFEKVLEIEPDFEGGRFALGNNAAQQGRYTEALKYFRQERENFTSDTDAAKRRAVLLQIGRAHKEIGAFDEAEEAVREAVRLDVTYAEAHSELGAIYEEAGRMEEALTARRKALELDPANGDYAYFLGALLVTIGRYEEAVEHLKRALEARPWFYGAHYNLGRSLIGVGRVEEGGRYLAAAESLQAVDAELGVARSTAEVHGTAQKWRDYGRMLEEAERYRDALDAYNVALSLDPEDAASAAAVEALRERLAAPPGS